MPAKMIALLLAAAGGKWSADLPPCASPGETTRFYPDAALQKGLEGEVVLNCVVGSGERFRRCSIASEMPEGVDFGTAALAMAKCEGEGKVPGSPGDFRILPVHFRLPGSATPIPAGGITVTAQPPISAVD